jgi:hypothetical protein
MGSRADKQLVSPHMGRREAVLFFVPREGRRACEKPQVNRDPKIIAAIIY